MAFYIGSDQILPRIPWDEARPAFWVGDLTDTDAIVARHFSKPYVCFVGAYEGCGCGFQTYDPPEWELPEDREVKRQQRALLARFLRDALRGSDTLELYTCWEGDQGLDVEHRDVIVPEELATTRERFREREMLTVAPARAPA